jgi:mono/diheme cytochrome c family protein
MQRICVMAMLAFLCVGVTQSRAEEGNPLEASQLFARKVRPLLESKCFDCHSSRADDVKSGLKLDSLEEILKGGAMGAAVVPGDPEASFLLKALRYEEADYQMPPAGKLSDDEIGLVEEWIRQLSTTSTKRPSK